MGGFDTAAQLREYIYSLVEEKVKAMAPQPRLATVQRIDRDNNVAWVSFPGDDGEIRFPLSPGFQPRHAAYDSEDGSAFADTVRVGGTPGNYYLVDVISSASVNQVVEADIESLMGDVATLQTDGLAPAASPVPALYAGIGSVAVTWNAIANADPLTVHIYASDTAGVSTDPVTATPIASVRGNGPGSVFIKSINTIPLVQGQTYYFKLVAEDADGRAAESPERSIKPAQATSDDIAVGAITTALLIANDAFVDALQASDLTAVTMTGALVQTDERPAMGVKLGQVSDEFNGLVAYGPSGDIFLKVDPALGMAIVAGEVKASTLTVFEGSALGGVTEISSGGRILLTGGTTAPKSAPTISSGYAQQQMFNDGNWVKRYGVTLDSATNVLYSVRIESDAMYAERWSMSTGKVITSVKLAPPGGGIPSDMLLAACMGPNNTYAIVYHNVKNNYWVLLSLNKTTLAWANDNLWADGGTDTRAAAVAWDSSASQWIIAQSNPANNDQVLLFRYPAIQAAKQNDMPRLNLQNGLYADVPYPYSLVSLVYSPGDFGSPRYIYSTRGSGGMRSTLTTPPSGSAVVADQFVEYWQSGVTTKRGLWWNSTKGAYEVITETGLLTTYGGNDKLVAYNDASLKKWVSSTLATGSGLTYETTQSPRAKITLAKRASLIVTTSAISNLGGATDPDRAVIYVGSGTNDPGRAAMRRQTILAPGTITATFTSIDTGTSTPTPPASSNYPPSAGSDFFANSGGFWVKDDSNGNVGIAGFRDSVVQAANNTLPYCMLSTTTAQTFANGWNTMTGWGEDRDPFDMHIAADPDSILITVAGIYLVEAGLAMNPTTSTTSRRILEIGYYTGTTIPTPGNNPTRLIRSEAGVNAQTYNGYAASRRVYLPAGAKVRADFYQNSGATIATRPQDLSPYLSVFKIRD